MGVLQRYKRDERARGRTLHEGRGTYIDRQKDLGINTDEATARALRAEERKFESSVATRKGEIGSIETDLLKSEKAMKADMIPVKYYTSGGEVYNYNLTRDTAASLYNNPDTFAVYGEDKGQKYVPIKRDQARYHTGGNKNIEGYKYVKWQSDLFPNLKGTKYTETPKEGGGQYEQNVLHLRAGSSKGSHPFAKALDDIQRQTDAQYTEAQKSIATGKKSISGARGVLKGTVEQRQEEWDAIRGRYEKRKETMRKILGGLDFG